TPSQGQTRRRARCRVRATLRFTGAAKVAELADAPDLGSGSRKAMGVRVPPFAPAFARSEQARATAWRPRRMAAAPKQRRGRVRRTVQQQVDHTDENRIR